MTLDPRKLNSESFTFTNDDLTEDSSIYTLEDELSETHIENPPPPSTNHREAFHIYDLPTHISSHHDVLAEGNPRTQPSTPVSTPYQEKPNHPLRALTSTHLVLNQPNGTDDSLITLETPPVSRGASNASNLKPALGFETYKKEEEEAQEQAEDWDERGAAQTVKKETNQLTGETEEIMIKRSVKDFKFGEPLGVGSYSTVILATDKNTGKNFAVKVLDKRHIIREKKVKYVNIEKNTLNRLGKRNGLIHLFFTFQDESSLYFVLDYASNGELLSLIKEHGTLNEETTRYYGAQILDAVKYMHDNGVVHRDLKPENILLDSRNRIQITDFGTAKLLEKNDAGRYPSDTKAKSFVGTAEYVSPELLNEKAIGKACDIWAFGCIVYQMIAGKPPFKAPNDYLTFQKIVKLQYAFTAGFPMSCRDLIKRILVLNPKDRYTIKEIQQHHFFQSIDFSNPKESIWKPDPPEAGPYKVNAKSMLPIPELNTNQSRSKIYLPPKRVGSSTSVPRTESTSSIDDSAISTESGSSQQPQSSPSAQSSQPTQSQQVLMRAKAAVAARKQQDATKRVPSAGNAANAASVALSRQPDQIIKAYNEKQERDKQVKKELEKLQTDDGRTPPLTASSNFKEILQQPQSQSQDPTTPTATSTTSPTIKPRSASSYKISLRDRKKPHSNGTGAITQTSVSPMTRLDLEFSNHLKNVDERVLRKGELNHYTTTTEAIERKYKGRLVDSPLGGNKSTTSSMLSRVANGSLSGLRHLDSSDDNGNSRIILSYSSESDENKDNSGAKTKFRKFFGGGSQEDEKRLRTLVATTNGRLLIFSKNVDKDDVLEVRTEIEISNLAVKIRELLPPAIKSANTGGLFIVEVYNTAFVFEGSQYDVTTWTQVLYKARTLPSERLAQKLIDEDPSGNAGTVLGSDAAKSAANLATINSPPLSATSNNSSELKSPVMLNLSTFGNDQSNVSKSVSSQNRHATTASTTTSTQTTTAAKPHGSVKHEGMFRDLVKSRTAQKNAASTNKEIPNSGQLHYGLPSSPTTTGNGTSPSSSGATRSSKTRNTSSSSGSKNPLIAAAEAAISNQRSKTLSTSSGTTSTKKSSGSNSSSSGSGVPGLPQNVPRLITGMNSRLLARSQHDKRKK